MKNLGRTTLLPGVNNVWILEEDDEEDEPKCGSRRWKCDKPGEYHHLDTMND